MAQKSVLGKASLCFRAMAPLPTTSAETSQAQQSAASAASAAGAATPVMESGNKDRHPGISLAMIDEIQVGAFQPRREFDEAAIEDLAQSIRSNGIIQPLVVRKTAEGYELIAGERRLRAAKKAGLKQIPIVIRRSTDREVLELALIENIQRQDLNCVEEAMAYFQLSQDFSLTQEEVATRVGKDRTTIANHLRLLRLPEVILDDLKTNRMSFGHGKVLLGLEDNALRLRAREQIVEKGMSVRDAEALVEHLQTHAAAGDQELAQEKASDDQLDALKNRMNQISQDLTRHWSTKVELKGSDRRGKIVLHYHTREELDRLISTLQR